MIGKLTKLFTRHSTPLEKIALAHQSLADSLNIEDYDNESSLAQGPQYDHLAKLCKQYRSEFFQQFTTAAGLDKFLKKNPGNNVLIRETVVEAMALRQSMLPIDAQSDLFTHSAINPVSTMLFAPTLPTGKVCATTFVIAEDLGDHANICFAAALKDHSLISCTQELKNDIAVALLPRFHPDQIRFFLYLQNEMMDAPKMSEAFGELYGINETPKPKNHPVYKEILDTVPKGVALRIQDISEYPAGSPSHRDLTLTRGYRDLLLSL